MFYKLLTHLAVLVSFCCTPVVAASLGSLTDSAGLPLVQASSCTLKPCIQGVAYGAGYLAGCQVILSSQDGTNSTTITSRNGTFTFPMDPATLMNASVSIPVSQANSSQLIVTNGTVYNCSDTATNQAPAFTLSALVPQNGSAVMALNAITTSGAQAIPQVGLIPAISQIVQSFLDVAGVDTPDRLFDVLSRFAPESPGLAAAPYINALRNVSDPVLAQYLVLNAQISNSLTLGAQRVASAVEAQQNSPVDARIATIDQAVSDLFQVLVPSVASSVSILGGNQASHTVNSTLTDVQSISTTLTSAVNGVASTVANGTAGEVAGALNGVAATVSALTSAFGRRLLSDRTTSSGLTGSSRQLLQSTDEVSSAVATVIAAINAQLAQLLTSGTINGTQLQQQVASLLYLAQTTVFSAVPTLATGTQAVADFTSQYTGVSLLRGVDYALGYVMREAPAFNTS
ncbi:hypothetical protein ABBQ38_006710 [Trebouxia sp. C0009 RCD-2024]